MTILQGSVHHSWHSSMRVTACGITMLARDPCTCSFSAGPSLLHASVCWHMFVTCMAKVSCVPVSITAEVRSS